MLKTLYKIARLNGSKFHSRIKVCSVLSILKHPDNGKLVFSVLEMGHLIECKKCYIHSMPPHETMPLHDFHNIFPKYLKKDNGYELLADVEKLLLSDYNNNTATGFMAKTLYHAVNTAGLKSYLLDYGFIEPAANKFIADTKKYFLELKERANIKSFN